jgi:hypothetical protein
VEVGQDAQQQHQQAADGQIPVQLAHAVTDNACNLIAHQQQQIA